jgi:hypothetical protein
MNLFEKTKKRLEEIEQQKQLYIAEIDLKTLKSNASRARSVTVGTAFGGVTEISLRGDGGDALWCLLQPVEVTELIHQLAGNIGCHINIQPRKDFASWREWREDTTGLLGGSTKPPHPNELATYHNVGAVLPAPEQQPGLNTKKRVRNKNEYETLAVEKSINPRKSKRTTTPT